MQEINRLFVQYEVQFYVFCSGFSTYSIVFFQNLREDQVKSTLQCNSNVLFALYNFI